jgi:hypothetical protein
VLDATGNETRIGYDAAVCLELFEPWVVEVYNSTTGVPSSMKLVGPGSRVEDVKQGEKRIGQVDMTGVNPQLNSSRLANV